MRKTLAALAVLPLIAITACTDDSSPEQVALQLQDIAQSHDCAAITSLTAPDLRANVECDDHLWGLVDEVAPMVNEALESGGTFTFDPNDANHAVLPFMCRGDEFAPCYLDVERVDGTWYLVDLG